MRTVHTQNNQTRYSYEVHAMTEGGDVTLLDGLPDHATARAIERAIEQHLDIVDQRMPGEYV